MDNYSQFNIIKIHVYTIYVHCRKIYNLFVQASETGICGFFFKCKNNIILLCIVIITTVDWYQLLSWVNMRQATCLKDEVLKFKKYDDRTSYYLLFWMNFVADLLWLFRSFYLLYAALPSRVSLKEIFLLKFYFDFT
jgi:hypothetical protein